MLCKPYQEHLIEMSGVFSAWNQGDDYRSIISRLSMLEIWFRPIDYRRGHKQLQLLTPNFR